LVEKLERSAKSVKQAAELKDTLKAQNVFNLVRQFIYLEDFRQLVTDSQRH